MLYHTEPFNLADDIAGEPLDYYARRAEYERILARHPIRPKRRSKPRSRVLSGR